MASGEVEACSNCRKYFAEKSLCQGPYPTVLVVGMGQHPITRQPFPIVESFHPMMPPTGWCAQHEFGDRPNLVVPKAPIATAEQVADALANVETEGTA